MARRPSSIDRLPAEIQELIGGLLSQGRTLDEIVAKLGELDIEISRSALGRHSKDLDKVGERMRRVREISNAFVEKLGAVPEGKQGRLILELMQTVVFDVLLAKGETDGDGKTTTVDAQEVFYLARAIKDLTSAEKISADRELKIRASALKEAFDDIEGAAKAAEKSGEPGLSAERVAQLRRDFLGVREAKAT